MEQWIGLGTFCLAVFGSAVASVRWVVLQLIASSKVEIEKSHSEKLAQLQKEVDKKISHGPAWFREYMDTQQQLFQQAIEISNRALAAASLHGNELQTMRKQLHDLEIKQDQMLELFKQLATE